MATFRVTDVEDPVAHTLLREYFDFRAATFPTVLGFYTPKYPWPTEFVPPHGVFLVVEDDGEVVGCGGVRSLSSTRYEIKHLWVQARARGRGLGKSVLCELEDRARSFGATETVLDTNASLAAAGQLYRSTGYSNIEPYNENPNATDWMLKQLPPSGG
ncbi:MAG TPA: GNAT family N-acetyltransferase [Galbitalea sp.]|jgi:ribosomal protein S18 acetylase RimI-like enzyme|nr:GNAT family N-acetyltransferase [Galbitalea sp.]